MTDQELKDLVASLAVCQAETDRQLKVLQAEVQDLKRQVEQITEQLVDEPPISWDDYTEDTIRSSVEKVLVSKFQVDWVAEENTSYKEGRELVVDILGATNSGSRAVVVNVASSADDYDLERLLDTLREFPQAFPYYAGKEVYGMLAAKSIPPDIRQKALELGLYVLRANAKSFKLQVPAKF